MADSNATVIDLDALDDPTFYIKLDGAEHQLKQLSVEDFIINTKAVQELELNKGLDNEVNMMIDMLGRSFPTVGADRFRKLPFAKIQMLIDAAQKHNGSKAGEASDDANPPKATDESSAA